MVIRAPQVRIILRSDTEACGDRIVSYVLPPLPQIICVPNDVVEVAVLPEELLELRVERNRRPLPGDFQACLEVAARIESAYEQMDMVRHHYTVRNCKQSLGACTKNLE